MEKQIINDYQNNFLSIAIIANKYHKGQDTIRKILKNNNVHIRSKAETAILKRNNYKFSLEEIEKYVLNNYVENHYGLLKSGEKYKLTANNVKTILKKYNITPRNFSEATILSNKNRALFKNENFFSIENENMAWLLGFLASDGNISKKDNTIKITVAEIDKEILEKIKNIVQIENNIKTYTDRKGYTSCTLSWTCQKHKEDLKKYFIVPNKTFILQPPITLNKKYWIDYIRGYFDGDGSINLIHNKKQISLRWQVCSATKNMLEWMLNILNEEYNINPVNIQTRKGNENTHDLYYIQYSTNATKQIFNIFYKENSLYLNRKYNHYCEILKSF